MRTRRRKLLGEAFPKWVVEPRADVPRVTARTAFAMRSSWGGPVTMGPACLSVMLLEHESSGAYLVGSSEMQQADTSVRAGVLRGLRDPPWVSDQPQLTLFPDGAQGRLPVPRCARLGEQHAKSLLLRGVCQCQGQMLPPRPSISNGICYSPGWSSCIAGRGLISSSEPSFCHHPHPKRFLGVIGCCASSGLHGL